MRDGDGAAVDHDHRGSRRRRRRWRCVVSLFGFIIVLVLVIAAASALVTPPAIGAARYRRELGAVLDDVVQPQEAAEGGGASGGVVVAADICRQITICRRSAVLARLWRLDRQEADVSVVLPERSLKVQTGSPFRVAVIITTTTTIITMPMAALVMPRHDVMVLWLKRSPLLFSFLSLRDSAAPP